MKRALINLLVTIALLLVLIAGLVIACDPFFHYHASGREGAYLYNEIYQTPGMARHFNYDTIIVGTSMTENFKVSWFGDYGEKAVKLCYSGARMSDEIELLEQAYASNNEITHIYMDINDYQLSEERGKRFGEPPKYLYDNNILTDVQYIYNKDVVIASVDRLISLFAPNDNEEDAFTWTDEALFGREMVLADIEGDRDSQEWVNDSDDALRYLECASQNMDDLCDYITRHPQTKFTLFYPPYSAVYWWDLRERGQLENKLEMYNMSIKRLMECENVEIYFFMDDYDVISNLDQYRDMCHYGIDVNRYMLDCMHEEHGKITSDDEEMRIEKLMEYVTGYEP